MTKPASGLSPALLKRAQEVVPKSSETPPVHLFVRGDIQLSETGLVLPEDMAFEDWASVGQTIRRVGRSASWWWGDWCNYGERTYGEKYAQALEASDLAYQTLANAAYVAEHVEVSRRRENLSFGHHAEVAALEGVDQDRYLDKAEADTLNVHELRRVVRHRVLDPPTPRPALPAGTFDVLLADPPWQYQFSETDTREIENKYPTLSAEDIATYAVDGRRVGALAAPNAVLFCWATSPKLAEALGVLEAWGFEYRTNMVWVKDKIGMGYYARSKHELLLIATRGTPGTPAEGDRPDSTFEAPRTEHSRKPDIAYDLIETMYPDRSYLELFARRGRHGWTSWGNEV